MSNRGKSAHFVVFTGLMAAISVMFALAANAFVSSSLFSLVMMAIVGCAATAKKGPVCGICVFIITSLLLVFTTGNWMLIAQYGLFFGLYPVLKYLIEDKIACKWLRWALKVIYFCMVSAAICIIAPKLGGLAWLPDFLGTKYGVIFGAVAVLCMIVYDIVLTYVISFVSRLLNRIWKG